MYFTGPSIRRSNGRGLNRHLPRNYLTWYMPPDANAAVDAVYRSDWGRIVATLIRLVRDFDVAEEAAQEAFAVAVDQWRASGVPEFPRAWIIQTARHKAIDRIRRQTRFAEKLDAYTAAGASLTVEAPEFDPGDIPDDRLRLIFTCCHPALALEAQVALTLRTLGGLQTDEIARVFLLPTATMAQRLVRAKGKIRDARLDESGDLVLLEAQDRRRWNHEQIAEALPLVDEALRGGPGPFALQAAIAALHCQAARAEDTDWPQIVRLYDLLERVQPSPIVSLNRAAAVAMMDGPRPALALVDELASTGDLDRYHLLHSARADLLRRLGSAEEAAKSYATAIGLCTNDAERRFLERRLREVQGRDHR